MKKKEIYSIAKQIFQNKNNEGRYLMMEILPEIDPFMMKYQDVDDVMVDDAPYASVVGAVDSFVQELSQYDTLKSLKVTMNTPTDFLVSYVVYDSKNDISSLMGFQAIDNKNILIDTPNHLFSLIKNDDKYNIYEYVIDNEQFVPKKRVRKNG